MIVTKGGIEKEAIFGVNIAYGTGAITIKTTKSEYIPGSDILVLGNVDTNTPILTHFIKIIRGWLLPGCHKTV